MGVRGHPEGHTVLSYFPTKVDGLLPLDKAMLRAWYSPKVRGGMTPFEVLPVLADELSATIADKAKAAQSRERFFANTVAQMQAFAEGSGDVPMIVKRCGKATAEGIRYGRMQMSYFLGVAYEKGATVPQDAAQSVRWLEKAVAMGSRTAQLRLNTSVAANR
jgi:TPR repeat protein